MKHILLCVAVCFLSLLAWGQNSNSLSLYEGSTVLQVDVVASDMPADSLLAHSYLRVIKSEFGITPQSQYSSIMGSFYTSKVNLLPFVERADLQLDPTAENGIKVTLLVRVKPTDTQPKRVTAFKNPQLLPVLYNSERIYVTMRAAASEMVYTNHNTWFGAPNQMTNGNPLADSPSGAGWSAWLEGFGSLGVYGVFQVIPKINLHLYGGASYLISYSAGPELFSNRARIYAGVEDAFVGIVGGQKLKSGHSYRYNITYGRKSFTLADGWLLINTSMNGNNRAALQLNPRWAARELFTAGFAWNRILLQGFSLQPNELDILDSRTVIRGLNLEASSSWNGTLGVAYLSVPESKFRYYLPDGRVYGRQGLQVFNLRAYKTTSSQGGLFAKAEGGYQKNRNFDMQAWAYYGEVGWSFTNVKGAPALSYRYAHFGGDNPQSPSYNRWDALYTGGNGEQWVQGSVMYKLVQNSNEITHRLQMVYNPARKLQMVGQLWLFYADQLNNIGGNPALSVLTDKFYGTEFNYTLKYFHNRQWYFHLNAAYALPGRGVANALGTTKVGDWFSATLFARYSL